MPARVIATVLAATVLVQLPTAGSLAAQDHGFLTPARFIRPLSSAASTLAPAAAAPASTPERAADLRKRLRRGRALIAVGSGLIAAGIVHAAALGHRGVCAYDDDRLILPPITGSIVAAAGRGMTLGGGFKIAGVPGEFAAPIR
jgi:hypothetical protein